MTSDGSCGALFAAHQELFALIMLSFPMPVHLVELCLLELRHLSVGRAEIQPSRGKQR